MSLPRDDQPVHFQGDIKPLFREKDRQSMRLHFDLGSYEDVSDHADRILERLRRGSMPCDGAWPPQQVEVFERWVRGGKLP
ncbi:MAG TPA: hypothetical protein VGA76_08225 [Candidatus Dormibacteraeota bacterium]